MAKSKQEIIDDIASCFKGRAYKNCYVGITLNVDDRLFGDHNVSREKSDWVYGTASSDNVAREIEQHFLDQAWMVVPAEEMKVQGSYMPIRRQQ